jgi:hypothetical protein
MEALRVSTLLGAWSERSLRRLEGRRCRNYGSKGLIRLRDERTLYWAPHHLVKLWNVKDIYITENGCGAADDLAADGAIYDTDWIMFLRNYLTQLQRATSEGVPVRGYPLEPDGQLRMVGRFRNPVRTDPGRLCDSKADAQAQRLVFQGSRRREPGGVRFQRE